MQSLRARHAVLGLLLASGSAFASFGAHYQGLSEDRSEFRFYLDGGAFLGTTGSFQSIRVMVHQFRHGRLRRAAEDCVYHFDPRDRRQDRVACAGPASQTLGGVEYRRPAASKGPPADEAQAMVCVRRCHAGAPRHLRLQAEEDNH